MNTNHPKFQPATFEEKWQLKWERDAQYKTPPLTADKSKKRYILDMFPYPSGSGLHVGHLEGFTATDIYCRYLRMNGYTVLHPMGFDSFGLPAENYAVKTGKHPKITTEDAITTFTLQMKRVGLSYDWDLTLAAHRPDYYRFTQWLFLLMYKRGLAYRKKQAVNWCGGCQTVLANEQVVDGKCERCETVVVQKEMEQWFLRITDYAERLLADLDELDWPESTKLGQRNWIGKSVGARIRFQVTSGEGQVDVFTTRPDTIFGVTFMAVAPEHALISTMKDKILNWQEVEKYVQEASKKTQLDRQKEKEKTGVRLDGIFVDHPITGTKIPVYVADYVLTSYGTGALMGVPGHDKRDFHFAKKYDLPVIRVIQGEDGEASEITQEEDIQEGLGTLMNSDFLNGLTQSEANTNILAYLELKNIGKSEVTYKLRDWLISRQRFWGAPIPMKKVVGSDKQETKYVPVDDSELPVMLPMDVEPKPTGRSPLAEHPDFVYREVDTLDTFVDSSWYFLRFSQLTAEKAKTDSKVNPFEDVELKKTMNAWCPVDLYMGGAEHTVLHLLYARFFTKVLFDAGYINFEEPFLKLRHQGIIMGPDHRKMSKRWGNVINPLDVASEYGADTLRMYEMFMGPIKDVKAWNVESVAGVYRFLARVWNSSSIAIKAKTSESDKGVKAALHKTIKKVSSDINDLKFNTAIASFMEFINTWEKVGADKISRADLGDFLRMLSPFAPFVTEELWSTLGNSKSIHNESWPEYKESLFVEDDVTIPVQINGKLRGTITLSKAISVSQEDVYSQAKKTENVAKHLVGDPKKIIYVPGKILNIII